MTRMLLAAIWIGAGAAVGLAILALYEVRRSPPPAGGNARPISIDLSPARRPHNPRERWTVTEAFAAHNTIVVHVETEHVHEARAIAQQVVDPIKDRYAEALIYVHRPGRPDALAPRRIQWTPAQGYVETVYETDADPPPAVRP